MHRIHALWLAPLCALLGCVELPIPIGDTGAELEPDTELEQCGPDDPSGTVAPETQASDAYPTPEGGTILDGVYDLVRFEIYSPASADDHQRQRRFVVSGDTIVAVNTDPGAAPEILGGTFTTDGTELKFAISCPESGEFSMPYTATQHELWLFDPSEPNLQVYARQ